MQKLIRFTGFGLVCCVLILSGCAGSRAARQKEKMGEVYLSNGTQMLMEGDSAQAITTLTMATRHLPKSHEAWNNLGLAFATQQDWKRAETAWKKAIQLNPGFSDARVNLGSFHLQNGKIREAEKEFRTVLEDVAYLKMFQVRYNLGLVYLKKGNTLGAENEFMSAARLDPTYCPTWAQLGMLQKSKGEYREAETSFRNAVKGTCFSDVASHFEIASLHIKIGDMEKARSKYLEIIQFFPDSEFARKAEQNLALMN